jgi:hypothetical protein
MGFFASTGSYCSVGSWRLMTYEKKPWIATGLFIFKMMGL